MRFQIGQEVVALKDILSSKNKLYLKKGNSYIVKKTGVHTCNGKTCFTISVGVFSDNKMQSDCCSFIFNIGDNIPFNEKFFISIDYTKTKTVSFEKIIKELPLLVN